MGTSHGILHTLQRVAVRKILPVGMGRGCSIVLLLIDIAKYSFKG